MTKWRRRFGVFSNFPRIKDASIAIFWVPNMFVPLDFCMHHLQWNTRARQIYFKAWDRRRHSLPDGSNLHRLRYFIKHVYVDRKYTGERSDRLPGLRLLIVLKKWLVRQVWDTLILYFRDTVDSSESMKVSVFSGGSKRPLYEDRHEWSSNEGYSPAGRSDAVKRIYNETGSPRSAQENSRYGGSRKTLCALRLLITGSDMMVLEVLGDKIITAFQEENLTYLSCYFVTLQTSSGGMESLIDFSRDSEPSNAEAAPNMQQETPSSDGGNQSSDELFSKGKAPPASNANSLELLLFDLSAPSLEPVDNVSAVQGTASAQSTASGQNISLDSVSPAAPAEPLLALTSSNGSSSVPPVINVSQKPSNVDPLQSGY
ncbi:hypothetical protein CRYUN_Cryun03dG0080800 [Craigia yunnanensis]